MLVSHKDKDVQFVAKALSENKLDPLPVSGFHAEPDYWMENVRWLRVVERYKWGMVLFISDRTRNAHASIVAVGNKIDLELGRVSTQGGWIDFQPSWYREMAMDLRQQVKQPTLQIPPCLGFREPDEICDGGMNKLKKMEPACGWRARCMALQTYADESGKNQEDLLKSKSPEQIVQMTQRLLDRKDKPNTKPKPKSLPIIQKQTPPSVQAAATEEAQNAVPTSNHAVRQVVTTVATEVAEATGAKVSPDCTREAAAIGDLYLVDRTTSSDYISIYKMAKPKPIALASFRIRAKVGMVVQLPLPKDSSLYKDLVDTDIKEWKDGAFKSAIKEVPLTGNRLEIVKHILVGIIQAVAA